MAARLVMRRRTVAAVAAASAGLGLVPRTLVDAEAPVDPVESTRRKPIYDDLPALSSTPAPAEHPHTTNPSKSPSPSPTDRLAAQIARTRLFIHKHAANLEDQMNNILTKAFNLEQSFTSTIASLAPGRDSNEKLMPGAIYVLVAAMGSSILVRNRNILLRLSVPLAVGVGAGWAIIPVTMRNVGDLAWRYEQKFPAVADTHVRVRDRVTQFVQTGVAHSKMSATMLEDKIREGRERVEEWVSKGK